MNQILTTRRIILTPELKRKRKMYKFDFFISVFLLCLLFSYYIYAEYDRNKNEEMSRDILASVEFLTEENNDTTMVKVEDNTLIVLLDEENANNEAIEIDIDQLIKESQSRGEGIIQTAPSGDTYEILGSINIPKLGINYPILSKSTEELLKISACKFWGPDLNEKGNAVIVAHNYKNKQFFGRLNEIKNGDIVEIKDMTGRVLKYQVYKQEVVEPTDTSCTTQKTKGRKEVTLITCTNNGKQRLVVYAREV